MLWSAHPLALGRICVWLMGSPRPRSRRICWLLDWEDWGLAPRGFDAAVLLVGSLAVPALYARIRREFAADLSGRDGLINILAATADVLTPDRAGEMLEPLRREAALAVRALRHR
jgi:hypothetical protein